MLEPRARDEPLRERELVPRFAVVDEDLAPPPELFAVERFAAGLRAEDVRVDPERDDLAAVERFAPPLLREPVLRELDELERELLLRPPLDLRAPPLLDRRDDELEPVLDPSSPDHLPDITRFAASATASAMSEPSLVALAIMLVAACDAVSAASSPASRILRRAEGLALIAAAAAARPAASISLLIAAFANLSTVSDLLDEVREELFLADFAIAYLPASR